MNIIVLTGYFKAKPNLKNNVAYGTIKTDKMFLDFVAFGDTANEIVKYNATDLMLVEGTLSMSKYNDKWRTQVKIQSAKPISTPVVSTPLENISLDSEDMETEIVSNNLDDLDLPDDDLPF